jgi:hypothetical protein
LTVNGGSVNPPILILPAKFVSDVPVPLLVNSKPPAPLWYEVTPPALSLITTLSASLNPALLAVIIPVLSVLTMLSLLPAVEILITSYVNAPSAVSSLSPAVLTTAPVLSRGSKGSTPVVASKSTPIRSLCSIAPPLSATVSNDTAVAVAVVFHLHYL